MISVCFSGADADFDANKGETWGSVENCLVGGGAYNQMKEKTPNAKYWYAFGGGNPQPNEWFTNDILNNLPSMDKINIELKRYSPFLLRMVNFDQNLIKFCYYFWHFLI